MKISLLGYRPFRNFGNDYVIVTCCLYGRICLSTKWLTQAAVTSETDRTKLLQCTERRVFSTTKHSKYQIKLHKIVSTEARYMVIKNQRFNPISACRNEFSTAHLWKSFYFGQSSGSV